MNKFFILLLMFSSFLSIADEKTLHGDIDKRLNEFQNNKISLEDFLMGFRNNFSMMSSDEIFEKFITKAKNDEKFINFLHTKSVENLTDKEKSDLYHEINNKMKEILDASEELNPQGIRLFWGAVNTEYAFQYWIPAQIDNVEHKTKGLNYGVIELAAKKKEYFNIFNFITPLLRYERSFGSSVTQKKLIETNDKEGWERFLIDFKLPFFKYFSNSFEFFYPFINYNKRTFISHLKTTKSSKYISNNTTMSLKKNQELSSKVAFQNFDIGLFMEGFNYTEGRVLYRFLTYQKPYSIFINDNTIYDSKFTGHGIGFQASSFKIPVPGNDFLTLIFELSILGGVAKINLDETKSIKDYIQKDENVFFYELSGGAGFTYKIFNKLRLKILPKCDYYSFQKTKKDSENSDEFYENLLNYDFILNFFAGLTLDF